MFLIHKLESLEGLRMGSHFYKQPCVCETYRKQANLARQKLNGCLQKHLNVSNAQIRNIGTPVNGFLFYKQPCVCETHKKQANLARQKLNGCLQKHFDVSNTQIRNIGTSANGFIFYKQPCACVETKQRHVNCEIKSLPAYHRIILRTNNSRFP